MENLNNSKTTTNSVPGALKPTTLPTNSCCSSHNSVDDRASGTVVPHKLGDIYYEGAIALIERLLCSTYEEYSSALKQIMAYNKKKEHTFGERQKYIYLLKTKAECESFYLSDRFIKFTLGKARPGKEVIYAIQKRVGYIK